LEKCLSIVYSFEYSCLKDILVTVNTFSFLALLNTDLPILKPFSSQLTLRFNEAEQRQIIIADNLKNLKKKFQFLKKAFFDTNFLKIIRHVKIHAGKV
jgi:hypothetical protein